jgi:hypothetical protein
MNFITLQKYGKFMRYLLNALSSQRLALLDLEKLEPWLDLGRRIPKVPDRKEFMVDGSLKLP